MRAAIIAAAGMATRFNADLSKPCLKCIYTENGIENTLLYNLLKRCADYDRVVVVGGYQYSALCNFMESCQKVLSDKIIMVENPDFSRYGTGHTFYLGLSAIRDIPVDEITLIEGDLFVDKESFACLEKSERDTISFCKDMICSSRSVAVYTDLKSRIHYLYQTDHSAFRIPEAFTSIFNSGQIWKFCDIKRLYALLDQMTQEQLRGTNLEIVQAYFGTLEQGQYNIVCMDTWLNCNTVEDYRQMARLLQGRKAL